MNKNEQLIHTFYNAFREKDYKTMQSCYSDKAVFSDPVFRDLDADKVRAMWEMFFVTNNGLKIEFDNIKANIREGSAHWTATYILSSTGNSVINHIESHFIFDDSQILKQTDKFSFYRWARQALGPAGFFLGWTPFIKKRVQNTAEKSLNSYIRKRKPITIQN